MWGNNLSTDCDFRALFVREIKKSALKLDSTTSPEKCTPLPLSNPLTARGSGNEKSPLMSCSHERDDRLGLGAPVVVQTTIFLVVTPCVQPTLSGVVCINILPTAVGAACDGRHQKTSWRCSDGANAVLGEASKFVKFLYLVPQGRKIARF